MHDHLLSSRPFIGPFRRRRGVREPEVALATVRLASRKRRLSLGHAAAGEWSRWSHSAVVVVVTGSAAPLRQQVDVVSRPFS